MLLRNYKICWFKLLVLLVGLFLFVFFDEFLWLVIWEVGRVLFGVYLKCIWNFLVFENRKKYIILMKK